MVKKTNVFLSILLTFILFGSFYTFALEKEHVIDELSYLEASEIEDLEASIQQIGEDQGLDVVIMITDDTGGQSSMAFADDYFDYNGYGMGSDYSGLMMLINMDEREVWISTTGHAIDIFTDARIDAMVDHVLNYLSDEAYYKASTQFLEDVESYAPLSYIERVTRNITSPILYLILLAISLAATLLAGYASKSKMTVSYNTYEDPASFVLLDQRDAFIREHQTCVKIVKSSGGGGSSTHTGSSGRSHGGGGGHF